MIRSFTMLHRVDPGFARTTSHHACRVPEPRYREQAKQTSIHREFLEALNSVPGVQAALVRELPMSGDYITHNFCDRGRLRSPQAASPKCKRARVEGEYFRVMGIPLLAGRDFGSQDRTAVWHVAVVNRAFRRQYFPGQDAVGARVQWARSDPPEWMTIVGCRRHQASWPRRTGREPAVYDLYSQTAPAMEALDVSRFAAPPRGNSARPSETAPVGHRQSLPVTQVFTMNEVVARP